MTAARRADQVMPDPVEHATGETLLENWLDHFLLELKDLWKLLLMRRFFEKYV